MKYQLDSVITSEQSVLGALLMEPDKLVEVRSILEIEDFYDEKNRAIYKAILELTDNEIEADTTTIFNEIYDNGAFRQTDASLYITEIYSNTPTSRNIIHYANLVKKFSIYREVKDILVNNIQKLNEDSSDLDSVVSEVVNQIEKASERAKTSQFKNIEDVTKHVFEELILRMSKDDNNKYILTGFSTLDNLLHGFSRGDLVILAARPSMGKTAFALNIAASVAGKHNAKEEDKKTVALFSLEMGAEQLVTRMLCSEGMLESEKIRTGKLSTEDLEKFDVATTFLNGKKIFIDDSAFIKVNEVKAKCKILKQNSNLDLVVIDYLQLLQGSRKTDNRQQEVSEISRSLKQMARELDCPVIALSQLSRSVESRQDKRPMMSDLRESGSIEQDADIVAFLYRDDYYNRDSEEEESDNKEVATVEVIVAKHRNGQTGVAELAFLKKYSKFVSKTI